MVGALLVGGVAPLATARQQGGRYAVSGTEASTVFPSGLSAGFAFKAGTDVAASNLTATGTGFQANFDTPYVVGQWFDAGDMTITFSQPVTNPQLDMLRAKFERERQFGDPTRNTWLSEELQFTIVSGNATISPVPGNAPYGLMHFYT
ncbi:hypothetical protein, partial [Isoptericola sp. NPDC056134]|uniref:hypothetical protein n=1 Tax=Isoptericola sp. NPDC056134 TaxID=3345723 RepID=UPI0035E8BBEE